MVTLEEATKIARGKNKNINVCQEYTKAYHFIQKTTNDMDGDSGVVVIKETGHVINWITFILDYHPETKPIKEFTL